MDEELSEKQKVTLWFVYLRWGAIALMISVIATSIYPGHLRISIIPNAIIIAIGILYNLIYPYFVRRWRPFAENIIFTYLRLTADLLIITFAVHFTGGVESPFKLLYLLEMAPLAFSGFEKLAYFGACQASIMYLFVTIPEALGRIHHYRLIAPPGTLYLDVNYGIAKALALLLSCWLLIYIASFLVDRLEEKEKQIEELSTAQIDFMNMVIHEVKSPLTSIIGYSELMHDQKLGAVAEPQKEPLAIIIRQSHRIQDLVSDLLDLARLESGRANIRKRPIDLAAVASRAIEELRPQLDARELVLVQEYDTATPKVNADEDKIHQVITNLLTNAIKFSDPKGKIILSLRPEGREACFSVRDEGLGIDPRDLPHIFEKFYRASKESAERKGTGLGLTVCRSIINAHGGSIWAVSAGLGQGAVFYFTLPL